jgi:LemA protein
MKMLALNRIRRINCVYGRQMNEFLIILLILVTIAAAIGIYIKNTYNALVALRNAADTSWAQIDSELQQRYDLIPTLVNTVKGYAAHERQTLEAVISARAKAVGATSNDSKLIENQGLTGALSKLMLLTENYPSLKADTSFLNLQGELSNIERRINLARRFYNESVLVYNTSQQQFPANLVAKPFGHTSDELYKSKSEASEPPPVEF